jgi:thiol:disulfide interchange protein
MKGMKASLKSIALLSLFSIVVAPAMAAPTPSAAKTLLGRATAEAKAGHKNVMVIFHASWCGWCKKMDAMLESPEFAKTFENSFAITHVVVQENGDKKKLENAGGAELMAKYGGATAGLPFFVILNAKGEKIGDSFLANKQNMGFPSEPQEVSTFMELMKKTAPKMTASELSSLESFLRHPKK